MAAVAAGSTAASAATVDEWHSLVPIDHEEVFYWPGARLIACSWLVCPAEAEAVGGAGRALVEVFWDGLVSEGEYADGYGAAGGMSEALWTSQQEAVVVAAEMIACAARGGYRPACLIGADREGFLEAWALGGAVSRLDSARSVYEACIQQTSG